MARARLAEGRSALHLDCFSGISGNMLLGALLELGASAAELRRMLDRLGIDGLRMRVSKVRRRGIAAHYVSFHGPERSPEERRYKDIRGLIESAELPGRVREGSLEVFELLARAEARVHGVDLDAVHFHEIGAVDTIGDIVGVVASLELLGVGRVTASAVALGHGTVETAHGRLPLPAPATLELLRNVPTYPAHVGWETTTPTGAALLRGVVHEFGPMPPLTIQSQGFGAGDDREGPMPNVLRAVLGQPDPALSGDVVVVLETNLDDMNPEMLPFLMERLMEEGALDVSLSPLSMKKGRPGQLLRVIVSPADRDRVARRILLDSSAIGVRQTEMSRIKLARETRVVQTPFGRIQVKVVRLPDGQLSSSPEYEACARAARKHAVSLLQVYRVASQLAEASEA